MNSSYGSHYHKKFALLLLTGILVTFICGIFFSGCNITVKVPRTDEPGTIISEASGTIILTYTDPSYFVTVFRALGADAPVCPPLTWFRDKFDYITVMSSTTGSARISQPFAETAQFMFAYWRDTELNVVGCTIGKIHSVDASKTESTERIPPFTPDISLTGRITIHNDDPGRRSIRVRIATSDIHSHDAVIEPRDSSLIAAGSSKTFTINIGEYSFVAFDGTTTTITHEARQFTITSESTTTPIEWRVNGDISD